MATIYSNRNDSAGAHVTKSTSDTSMWAGAIVPAPADTVYIVGRRTQINQSAFAKWAGTRTITVDSTTGFATSGFFYTVTDKSQILKINYTGLTATTFTGCSIDESDPFYVWDEGGSIADNQYVHNPAYVVRIGAGETFTCTVLYIQEGGWLLIEEGGSLVITQALYVRDGRLVGRGNGTITISRPSAALANIGELIAENYALSVIDLDGGETNLHGYTTTPSVKGDVSVTVASQINGTFAIGDEVNLYREQDNRRRNRGYNGYRDATASFRYMDEGFDVCGVNGNNIYLAIRNGARGTIKAVSTEGPQKVLEVKPDTVYFNEGDILVINNTKYTIDKIEDSEVLIKEYDFTNPSTDLSDFIINDPAAIYSGGWVIESGIGLRNTIGGYKEFINKYIWSREIIVEAEMSPLSQYSTGTRGTEDFGIVAAYDPAYRFGHRGYDPFKMDIFRVDDAANAISYYIRAMANYVSNTLSRNTAFRTELQKPALYRLDKRKHEATVHINGTHFTTEYERNGAFKGLCGLFIDGNTNFRCKSLKLKYPTQKIYLTTTDSFSANQRVFRSGMEWDHPANSKLLKTASINTGNGSHTDLAFAYTGQNGSGIWPQIIQINGVDAVNSSLPYLHNHDVNPDYYLDLGNGTTARSITIDLQSQKTFTHVSFKPRLNDYSNRYGMNGVAIYGSNDKTNWVPLYGPTNDTKIWYYLNYNNLAFYPTGTASYRYVKFETKGAQHATYFTNRYVEIGVHDFSSGYTLNLNNASDFNIGDKITIFADSGFGWGSKELDGYYGCTDTKDPETMYHGGWLPECTITNKIGNVLYLDRPIFWGFIEDYDSVTISKVNKPFIVQGTIGYTGSTEDWRWPNITLSAGSSNGRFYSFKNVRFNYIGSYRYSSSTSHNRGFRIYSYDYWLPVILDGCTHMMGPDGTTYVGIIFFGAFAIARNSVAIGMYTIYQIYTNSSYTGVALFNNKTMSSMYGVLTEAAELFTINYNEITMTEYGIRAGSGMRSERMVQPHLNEISRNYIKGTSYTGISIVDETIGPRRSPRIKLISNKTRGMDDYVFEGRSFSAWPFIDGDFMSEHTGSRVSRYRNEGMAASGAISNDLSFQSINENFGRFGYDLGFGFYHFVKRDHKTPEITRFYNPSGDSFLYFIGIELDVLEDVPFKIAVQFDYRVPLLRTLQDDGTSDGAIRIFSLQHGTILQTITDVAPATLIPGKWYTLSATFDTFAAEEGRAGVFVTSSFQNGYLDVRNGNAVVLTDDAEGIRVVGNTFKLQNIWDQHREIRDMRRLTNATPVKFNNVKF